MLTLSYFLSNYFIIINLLFSFFKMNIKYLVLIMILFMWILYFGNFDNPDYTNYLHRYNYIKENGLSFVANELGFLSLMRVATFFDLSYNYFLMVISFLSLTLIYATIKRYTNQLLYVWSLYFIYPFILDIVQVRHFLAMSIVVYSIKHIEEERYIKYIFSILIAFSMHFAAIVFLPFLILQKMKVKTLWITVIIIIIIGIFFIKTNLFILILDTIAPMEKMILYLENPAHLGFLLPWAIQILFLIPVYYIYQNIYSRFVEIVYKINIYMLMMFPLYMISITVSRTYRMIIILNYILFAIGFYKLPKNGQYLLFIYVLLLVTMMQYFGIWAHGSDLVLSPIFQNNFILN